MTAPVATLTPPASVAEIDGGWLTAALQQAGTLPEGSSVEVAAATALGDGSGWMCEVARLDLEITGDRGSLPQQVVVKIPVADENVRAMLAPARLYEREGRFFEHAAAELGHSVPRPYLVIEDPDKGDHCLIIEWFEGGSFGDQRAGCSAAQAESALGCMARMHARFWDSPELDSFDWLPPINFEGNTMGPDLYRMSVDGFTDKFGHLLDPANEVITNTLPDHGLRLLDELAEPPHTLIHFDFRLDNLFFGDSGSATAVQMIDFQTVSRANPGYDLGYFLTQSLEPDVRRRHEDELLAAYLNELAAAGVSGYSMEQARRHYRCGALYAWITPVFVMANLDMSNPRATEMWSAVTRRCQAAQVDLSLAELIS